MQALTMVPDEKGAAYGMRRAVRNDAIRDPRDGLYFVPTRYGEADAANNTKWIGTLAEFRAAGGHVCFSEDQTYIELMLPEGFKFGTGFPNDAPTPSRESFNLTETANPDGSVTFALPVGNGALGPLSFGAMPVAKVRQIDGADTIKGESYYRLELSEAVTAKRHRHGQPVDTFYPCESMRSAAALALHFATEFFDRP